MTGGCSPRLTISWSADPISAANASKNRSSVSFSTHADLRPSRQASPAPRPRHHSNRGRHPASSPPRRDAPPIHLSWQQSGTDEHRHSQPSRRPAPPRFARRRPAARAPPPCTPDTNNHGGLSIGSVALPGRDERCLEGLQQPPPTKAELRHESLRGRSPRPDEISAGCSSSPRAHGLSVNFVTAESLREAWGRPVAPQR